jgi:DNA-binding transcriptional ArsR family regulator
MDNIIHVVDKSPPPPLLPILRSQQQADLLAMLLGEPSLVISVTDLALRLGMPYPTVHREVERAEACGLITSRRVGRTRLVGANTASPYFAGLSDVLTKAFGVHTSLATAIRTVPGVHRALIFGSWAARFHGEAGVRPVGDIDLLVLGDPDRDALFGAIELVQTRVGRPINVTIRNQHWLATGEGSFHDTVASRPVVEVPL